jgi:phospholipase B1
MNNRTFCNCVFENSHKPTLEGLTKGFQRGVEDLINSGRYDTKDDFTVVVQPFMTKMSPPTTSTGAADYSYFAPDCFHFSTKGHQAAAIELWNSLVGALFINLHFIGFLI